MKKALLNIALSFMSLFLALLFSEAVIRLVKPQPMYEIGGEHYAYGRYDPYLGWTIRKNVSVRVRQNREGRETLIRTNGMGFRGGEFSTEKPKGVKRVVVMGDSVTFGYGLDEEDAYPTLLQGALGGGYEVINAGVVGYGTDQEYLFFKERVAGLRPDILIVGFSGGDIYDNSCSARFGNHKPYFRLEGGRLALSGVPVPERLPFEELFLRGRPVQRFFFKRSHLYRFAASRLSDPYAAYFYNKEEMGVSEGAEVTVRTVEAFRDSCRAAGCRVLFPVVPQGDWLRRASSEPHEAALRAVRAAGVPYIDLWEPFRAGLDEGIFLKGDPVHTNRRGNEIIAAHLAEAVNRQMTE